MTNIQTGLLIIGITIVVILIAAEHIFHGNIAESLKRKKGKK